MSPSSCRRTKTSRTARESPSSMVKRSRSQSRRGAQRLVLLRRCGSRTAPSRPRPARRNSSRPRSWRLFFSVLLQLLLHHHLRGDAGVVGAGEPEGVEAGDALPADEDVLQRGGERVAEVERAGDVGRRQHDGEGRPGPVVLVAVEVAALLPEPVPAGLDLAVLVALGQLGRGLLRASFCCSTSCSWRRRRRRPRLAAAGLARVGRVVGAGGSGLSPGAPSRAGRGSRG